MEKKLRPYHGLILFGIFLLFMPTVGAVLQAYMGLGGTAITELCLLFLAVLFPRAIGVELKDVFDLTPPPVSKFFGSLALGGGVLLMTTSVDMLLAYFFPAAGQTADSLSTLITSSSPAVAVITVAILPAICEELLFRGAIQSSFRSWKHDWLIALVVGLLFGIGHFDLYRLIPTGALGAAFAYIGLKSGSIFLGCLLHFIVNILSVVSSYTGAGESASSITEYTIAAVGGSALVYLALGLVLIVIGRSILISKKISPRLYFGAGIPAALLFLTGIGMTAIGADMTTAQAIGSVFYYTAMAITVLFIGWLLLTRKKPTKPLIAVVCSAAVLCFGIGTTMTMLGGEPAIYTGRMNLSASKTEVTETFTVEKEGEYLLTVSAKGIASTVRVSVFQVLPADSAPVQTTQTDLPETDSPDSPSTAAPEKDVTYIATFEGSYIGAQSRLVHLTPGAYTVQATLTPEPDAKDREVSALAIIALSRIAGL